METSIGISRAVKEKLEKLKLHPREPYEDVIKRLIDEHEKYLKK